jgi:hypothetical protein
VTDADESSSLRRIFALSAGERRLLLEAWWRLAGVALRLRISPRRAIASALTEGAASRLRATDGETISASTRAVARAAAHHLVPMTCLPRALALQRMLARRGIASRVAIGVRKESGRIAAHAWVEIGGQPVGEPEAIAQRFLPFLPAAMS